MLQRNFRYPASVSRPPYRRRARMSPLGCAVILVGAGLLCGIGVLLLLPALPTLALRVAGFEPAGDTGSVFTAVTPAPALPLADAARPAQVVIAAPGYRDFALDPAAATVNVGQVNGAEVATAYFTESQLTELCRQRTPICTHAGDGRARNVVLDLRPGGAVVTGDFLIPPVGVWQRAGIVLKIIAGARVEVVGVDLNGILYSVPPGDLGETVDRVAATAQDLIRTATITADGQAFQVAELYADDTTLTVILR